MSHLHPYVLIKYVMKARHVRPVHSIVVNVHLPHHIVVTKSVIVLKPVKVVHKIVVNALHLHQFVETNSVIQMNHVRHALKIVAPAHHAVVTRSATVKRRVKHVLVTVASVRLHLQLIAL